MAREQFDKYFVRPSGIDPKTGAQTADLTVYPDTRLIGVPIVVARHIYRVNQSVLSSGLEIGDHFELQIPRRSIDTKNHKIRPTTWVPTQDRRVMFRGIGADGIIVDDPSVEGGTRSLSVPMKNILALRRKKSESTQGNTAADGIQSTPKPKQAESVKPAKIEMGRDPSPHFVNFLTPDGSKKMVVLSVQNPKGAIVDYVFQTNIKMEGSNGTERMLLEDQLRSWKQNQGLDVIIGSGIDLTGNTGDKPKTIVQDGVFGLYINKRQISGLREEERKRLIRNAVTNYQI